MKDKITKGDWSVSSEKHGQFVMSGNFAICQTNDYQGCLQSTSDAKLIAEAGTITNQCGFSPSELLEQRNELLDAINSAMIIRDLWGVPDNIVDTNEESLGEMQALSSMEEVFKKAIQKTKP